MLCFLYICILFIRVIDVVLILVYVYEPTVLRMQQYRIVIIQNSLRFTTFAKCRQHTVIKPYFAP